jgi:hypothetical protein
MAKNKVTRLSVAGCLALLLSTITVSAQNGSHYSTSNSAPTMSDATSGCVVGGRQCWIPISTTPAFTQVSAASDGTVYGLDGTGKIWSLDSHTWQSTTLSPMVEISAVSVSNVYGLQVATSFCGLPEMQIYQYTGGADFARFNYCAVHIGAAPDGTLYRIRSSGNVTHLVNGAWISDPTAGGNGTPTKIVVGSKSNVWLITSTGVIKTLDSSGSFVVVLGTASDIATSGDPLAGTARTFIVGATANSNNVYEYSSSTGSTTGTWTALIGVLDTISTGGQFLTLGIRRSLNTVYHFNPIRVSFTAQTTGYYDCSVFTQGCPLGSTHTATTTVAFSSGGHGQTASSAGAPSQTLNATVYPYTDDCDPIFGVPNAPECQATINGSVNCSKMGGIFSAFPNIKFTRTYWTGAIQMGDNCTYTILACSNATNPTCKSATPALSFTMGCPKYVKASYWVYNGTCVFAEVFTASGPGPCT